jgi:hypothetical protein
MTLALGSVLLALLNLASAALIAERRRAGWLVALAAQIPWTWYDLWTRQLGFLLLTLIYVPVYVRGWRKARNPARLPSSRAGGSPAAETANTLGNWATVTSAEPIGFELADDYPARPALAVPSPCPAIAVGSSRRTGMSQVVIGMDPHKRSATIEIMAGDEAIWAAGGMPPT